jgi:hypothetical protein
MIGRSDESSSIGVNIMVGCQFTATAIAHQYQALHVHRTDAVQQYSHLPRDTLSTSSTDRQHHGSSGRPPSSAYDVPMKLPPRVPPSTDKQRQTR